MQIWQHNIYYTNVITIKNIIAAAKKVREIQGPLAKKVGKAAIAEVVEMASAIHIGNKYR